MRRWTRTSRRSPRASAAPCLRVAVDDNQVVEAGAVLVEIDPRDYQVAVDKARAELADAEALGGRRAEQRADYVDPTASSVTTAQGGVDAGAARRDGGREGSRGGAGASGHGPGPPARGRGERHEGRRATSNGCGGCSPRTKCRSSSSTRRSAPPEAQTAAVDSAKSQVVEAEAGIRVAESRLAQARAGEQQAHAALRDGSDRTASRSRPSRRAPPRRKRASQQARAALAQAELNLQYTTVKAPASGRRSRKKSVKPGQVVQAGQPLLGDRAARRRVGDGELQGERSCSDMRPGQRVDDRRGRLRRPRVHGQRRQHRRPPPARGSACCRRKTPPATTSRSCSACR